MYIYIPIGLIPVLSFIAMFGAWLAVVSFRQRQRMMSLIEGSIYVTKGLVVSNDMLMTKIDNVTKHLEQRGIYR